MKHLLIIPSILILSSHVIGDSKTSETIYEWKTSFGTQWREIGDKDFQAKYNGAIKRQSTNIRAQTIELLTKCFE